MPLTLSLFLWGCSTPYIEPIGEPNTATIYFSGRPLSWVYITDFPLLCTSPKAVHVTANYKKNDHAKVPANKLLTFRYFYRNYEGNFVLDCNEFVVSFVPKAGRHYMTQVDFDRKSKTCYLRLYEISPDQYGFNNKPEPYIKRTYTSRPKGLSELGVAIRDIQCTDGAELLPWLTKNHYTY